MRPMNHFSRMHLQFPYQLIAVDCILAHNIHPSSVGQIAPELKWNRYRFDLDAQTALISKQSMCGLPELKLHNNFIVMALIALLLFHLIIF